MTGPYDAADLTWSSASGLTPLPSWTGYLNGSTLTLHAEADCGQRRRRNLCEVTGVELAQLLEAPQIRKCPRCVPAPASPS